MVAKETSCILSYGYKELVDITGGLHPGELILVGARPGMGSSRFIYSVLARLCDCEYVLLTACDFALEIAEIRKRLQMVRSTLLVIDSVRLVAYSEANEKGTPNNFGDFFIQLKELAQEFSLPIVVVAKWPRVCETRYEDSGNARPLLDDFSATTITEKNFDTVLFLYRNDYYYYFDTGNLSVPNRQTNIMEVIVAKSFSTKTGVCKLHYNNETGCISEIN